MSSTSWSSSETLSACAARASAWSRAAWVSRRCSESSRARPSAAWLASVSAISVSSGRPDVRGAAGDDGHRVHVARPRERDEQRGAGLQRGGELGAELGDQPALLERERARRGHDVRDRGRARGGGEDVDGVGAERAPRLGDQRRAELIRRARRQRRLGETAERGVRGVRAGCRGAGQGA